MKLVGKLGFESRPRDPKSRRLPLPHIPKCVLVDHHGFEPCSVGCRPTALPNELAAHKVELSRARGRCWLGLTGTNRHLLDDPFPFRKEGFVGGQSRNRGVGVSRRLRAFSGVTYFSRNSLEACRAADLPQSVGRREERWYPLGRAKSVSAMAITPASCL